MNISAVRLSLDPSGTKDPKHCLVTPCDALDIWATALGAICEASCSDSDASSRGFQRCGVLTWTYPLLSGQLGTVELSALFHLWYLYILYVYIYIWPSDQICVQCRLCHM